MSEHGIRPTAIVAIDRLRPHPRNYRSHPPDQIEHLARSITLHGIFRNVVVARDDTILAGHGVVGALLHLGRTEVPVVKLDLDPLAPEALHVLAADNEIAALSEIDDRRLTELLRELVEEDADLLLGTGYDDEKLAALVLATRGRDEIPDFDAAAEWVGLPGYEQPPNEPQLLVRFNTPEDRDKLLDIMGVEAPYYRRATNDRWAVWWPDQERDDPGAVGFEP